MHADGADSVGNFPAITVVASAWRWGGEGWPASQSAKGHQEPWSMDNRSGREVQLLYAVGRGSSGVMRSRKIMQVTTVICFL